jgi:cytochrome c biogenesis protein
VAREQAKLRNVAQDDERSVSETASAARSSGLDRVVDLIWETFTSVRLAIILILAIAAASFIGAAIVQAPPPALEDPARFEQWVEGVRPKYGIWTNVFAWLGFFSLFTATWFRLLIVLMAANVMVCTLHRTPGILRIVRRQPPVRVSAAMFERAPLHTSIDAGESDEDVAAANVVAAFHWRRLRVRQEQDGDTIHLFGEKNRYARLGTLAHHAGLIVVLLGAVWGGQGGWREPQVVIPEGSEFQVGHETGVTIRLDDFIDEYYTGGGGIPKDYRSNVVLIQNGQEVASGTVRVNEPLIYQGLRVHQAFYGPAIVMNIAGSDGTQLFEGPVPLTWSAEDRPAGELLVPGTSLRVFVLAPASAFIDPVIRPGTIRLEIYEMTGSAPLAMENISQSTPKSIAGLTYTFVRESRFSGLQVVRDPGLPLVWFGSAVIVLGAIVALMFPHRRIWARVERDDNGAVSVRMAAARERGLPFDLEFKHLASSVEGRLAPPSAKTGR